MRRDKGKKLIISVIVVVILLLAIILLLNYFGVFNKISGKVTGNAVSISCITNSNCPKGYVCNVQIHTCEDQIKLSLATLKDVYKKGEIIQLTDPPEENSEVKEIESTKDGEIIEKVIEDTSLQKNQNNYYNYPEIGISSVYSRDETIVMKKDIDENKVYAGNISFKGYIIEFQQQPLVKKQVELTETSKRDKSLTLRKIKTELALQKQRINSEHTTFKQAFSRDKSLQQPKILGEYTKTFNGIALDVSNQDIEKIKEIPEIKKIIKSITPNYKVHTTLMDSVPLIQGGIPSGQLDIDGNNCISTGKECLTGKGVKIAIIDTGVDYTHPDLGGCIGIGCKVIGGYDFVNNDNDPIDDAGHGTHVAATSSGNGVLKGVTPEAKIVAYKVLNSEGSGTMSSIILAIERAVDPNQDGDFLDYVNIISMSLGVDCSQYGGYSLSCGPDDAVSKAVDNAVNMGVVAVIAAGNSGPYESRIGSPGTARNAITVGAVYKRDYNNFLIGCNPGEILEFPKYSNCGSNYPFSESNYPNLICSDDGKAMCRYWLNDNPRKDQITSFSSRGPVAWENNEGNKKIIIKPDIVSPGAIICAARYDSIFPEGENKYYTPCVDDKHVLLAGTSMATPIVSGAVALIKQAHPGWTPEEIKSALKGTAKDLGLSPIEQGAGRIDVKEVVKIEGKPLIAELSEMNYEVSGIIDITGTVKGNNFQRYGVYYSKEGEDDWKLICSGINQVENEILCGGFDTGNLIDGKYEIKLNVFGSGERKNEDYNYFTVKNIKITYPQENKLGLSYAQDIFGKDKIEIKGTIYSSNFNNYELKYRFDNNWKSITGKVNNQVSNGVLGIWDTTNIPSSENGVYYLGIFLNDESDPSETIQIIIDTMLKENWPKYISYDSEDWWTRQVRPTVVDLNHDGSKEIVANSHVWSESMEIYLWDYKGNLLPGWPFITPKIPFNPSSQIIATGDVNEDGIDEVFILVQAIDKIYVYAVDYNGNLVREWNSNYLWSESTESIYGSINFIDINNDLSEEIIITTSGGSIYVFNRDGTILNGWPQIISHKEWFGYSTLKIPSPAIADIDNDGYKEIIKIFPDFSQEYEVERTLVTIWNHDGTIHRGWPKEVDGFAFSSPVVGDINNDGYKEIIFGSNNKNLYVYNHEGIAENGWPNQLNDEILASPALADINDDGNLDIIAYTFIGYGDFNMYLFNKDGTLFSDYPILTPGGAPYSELAIGDINNDGFAEIFGAAGDYIYAYTKEGIILDNWLRNMGYRMSNSLITIDDIDNDGKIDIIAGTNLGEVLVWELDTPYNPSTMEWPMFQHDAQHTGCYDCDITPVAIRPQSKIVNNLNTPLSGIVTFKIEVFENNRWSKYHGERSRSSRVSIPAKGLVKLDKIFNNYKISIDEVGKYRVVATFTDTSRKIKREAFWEFRVVA